MNLGMLQDAGINCHIKDEYTITIDPLLSPALGGMKLMVEENDVEKAITLLVDAEKQYVASIPCPDCQRMQMELITETTSYNNWAGKIKSLLLNGQEQQVKIFYRCSHCNATFRELPASAS